LQLSLLCYSVHFVLVSVSLQLSVLILTAKFSDDCVIHWLVTFCGCTFGTDTGTCVISLLYKRYYRDPSSLECQSEWRIAHGTRMTPWWRCSCCWPAGGIEFDSDLALITVDTHTGAWVAALRAGFDLTLFGFDAFAWWWMRLCCRL